MATLGLPLSKFNSSSSKANLREFKPKSTVSSVSDSQRIVKHGPQRNITVWVQYSNWTDQDLQKANSYASQLIIRHPYRAHVRRSHSPRLLPYSFLLLLRRLRMRFENSHKGRHPSAEIDVMPVLKSIIALLKQPDQRPRPMLWHGTRNRTDIPGTLTSRQRTTCGRKTYLTELTNILGYNDFDFSTLAKAIRATRCCLAYHSAFPCSRKPVMMRIGR